MAYNVEVAPSGLLFADNTALLAHDEDNLRKSLNCLVEWCEEWGVGINLSKCSIVHMRKKGVERSEMSYSINGELPLVSNYKYLGCTVDEHLDLDDMVEVKSVDGKKALGAWFQRWDVKKGGVEIITFKRLMSSLVESTMAYGVEIWGCNRNMHGNSAAGPTQSSPFVYWCGQPPPKSSLLWELGDLPVVWPAKLRYVVFWFKVLISPLYDKRWLRRVATESVRHGKGSWMRKMARCCQDFDWENVGQPQIQNLSETELREMLESVAWRKVKEKWREELERRPKLSTMQTIIMKCGKIARVAMCWDRDEQREENDA